MFDQDIFDVYPFENIPLDRDCYLMDECYIEDYKAWMHDVVYERQGEPVGEISYVAARCVHNETLDLSWYPNVSSRFHEVPISLPKDQFVACVGSWKYSEKPHIFVKSEWLEELYLRSYTVFVLVDAIGVKTAIKNGLLSRDKLIRLREAIDNLAKNYLNVCFISFADSLLIKSNWTAGNSQSNPPYTYKPEEFVYIIKDIQAIYKAILGLDVYAILTQGTNAYYKDSLIHISDQENHISLNSLGIPFAQLMAVESAVRSAIKAKEHEAFDLYIDEHFYNSLLFRFGFRDRDRCKFTYSAPMMSVDCYYYCASLQEILTNLESIDQD